MYMLTALKSAFFLPGKPKMPDVETVKIPGNESPALHTGNRSMSHLPTFCFFVNFLPEVYVWDHFVRKAQAAEIVIVAHSGTFI